jgi:colanic acid biosynthesis glycosyl transferase WcaI
MGVQAVDAERVNWTTTPWARPGVAELTGGPKRLIVHDFAGHPFQIDLSRELAQRGHEVLHVYCESYTSGKGRFDTEDLPNLDVVALPVGDEFARYSPIERVRQELRYGRRFTDVAAAFGPDLIISSNVPLVSLRTAARWCRRNDVPWVFWLQDLYSRAVTATAEAKAGVVGRQLSQGFVALERSLLRQAAHVVPITRDFAPVLDRWGIPCARTTVIENWAPLDDLPLQPRESRWRAEHGLGDRFVYLYSGTLGLKHRPEFLYELAEQCVDDADVVVISEGRGEARLREMQTDHELPNLHLLPFQPFDRYPEILGSADVLVALLEPSAGEFSVPSKVLSYLCAGRPLLAAIPPQNLAARTIERAGAGQVTAPNDVEGFLLAAKRLRVEAGPRFEAGRRARAYAEATFDTEAIADRFTAVLGAALGDQLGEHTRRHS